MTSYGFKILWKTLLFTLPITNHLRCFGLVIGPEFEDENLTEKFSAGKEFRKIGPWRPLCRRRTRGAAGGRWRWSPDAGGRVCCKRNGPD
jgi:hypothetical protein